MKNLLTLKNHQLQNLAQKCIFGGAANGVGTVDIVMRDARQALVQKKDYDSIDAAPEE